MRVLRLPALQEKLGLRHSAVYQRLRDDPSFPKPIRLGGRAVGWVEDEIDEWLRQRAAERDKATA
jgi:prophage regulatory protein